MARTVQIIFINCWKCGRKFQVAEPDYYNGAICEDCF